jgi:hypothetical protein
MTAPHDEAVNFIYRNAPVYAQAKANRIYLEEFRKSKKALLMGECNESAANAREQYAYAHKDYQQLLDGLKTAVEVEETLKWQMVAAQARIEIWRTESANNRSIDRATQ